MTEKIGIAPGPQKIETLLNAYEEALDTSSTDRRVRQYLAFRDRIIKMDALKDAEIEGQFKALARQAAVSEEKDKRIAELEERIQTTWWDQDDY